MKVKALRSHPYAGIMHKKGSEYEIFSEKDLNLLIGLKAVEVVKDKPQAYSRQDMQAQENANPQPATRPKRTYKRRDMRAGTVKKRRSKTCA